MPPETIFRRFEMAAWSPTEIRVPFSTREEEVGAALDRVRDAHLLRRDGIHTLDFFGTGGLWPYFSWIFDEPLPNLKHLSISKALSPSIAIPPIDSIGKCLETLSIHNVEIPASLRYLCSLKKLRIDISSARYLMVDQLTTLLDSVPRLETFFLTCTDPDDPLPNESQPKHVVTLSHLTSLRLVAPVSEVESMLDHLSLPAIDSLTLCSVDSVSSQIRLCGFQNIIVDYRFKGTPNFPRSTTSGTQVRMCGFQTDRHPMRAPGGWAELFPAMDRIVPLSVTELEVTRDTLDERRWREFAERRPGVRSIVSSYDSKNFALSRGLWRALSPNHPPHPAVLFPKFESVTLKAEHPSMIPSAALCCLRMRSEAGFKLKRLEVQGTGKLCHAGRQAEDFRPLADVFVYSEAPMRLWDMR